MDSTQLPALPDGVEYLQSREETTEDGGLSLPVLKAVYRVHGLTVVIGWISGHPMGDFREPNSLQIDFDSYDYGISDDASPERAGNRAFEGITTSVLRSIPMAHAKALMQERYEQINLADIQRRLRKLPSRVETDSQYIHIATAYQALAAVSVEPVKRLNEWTGESVETWSARLRRARAKGILEGKGRASRVAPAYRDVANELWSGGTGEDSH
jgi:hypothetical protein